ncbi:YfhE family protein [Bacillus shivajii]|nr:YfhE family protein [Bacillus shivajii]UCZ54092.1 YfhE family protein [Bacillus shivajii]
MKSKARKSKEERRRMSRAQEVHYQSEFKAADRMFTQSKNNL